MKNKLTAALVILIFLVSVISVYASPQQEPESTAPKPGEQPGEEAKAPAPAATQPTAEQRRAFMAAEATANQAYNQQLETIQKRLNNLEITGTQANDLRNAAYQERKKELDKLHKQYPDLPETVTPTLEEADPAAYQTYQNYVKAIAEADTQDAAARFANAFDGLTVEQQRRVVDALQRGGYAAEYARETTEAGDELRAAREQYTDPTSKERQEAEEDYVRAMQEAAEKLGKAANEEADKVRKEKTVLFTNAWSSIVGTAAGFSGYSSIVEDEQYLEFMDRSWNPVIDAVFNNIITGGVDVWTSEICKVKVRRHGPASNILYTESGGRPQTSVFANGERSQLIHPNGTIEYFYKLSYYVNIPEIAGTTSLGQTMGVTRTQARGPPEGYFNVFVKDSIGNKHPLYIDLENPTLQLNLPLEDGAYALLTSMKVFYSKRAYKEILIEFYKHKGDTSPTLDLHFLDKSLRYYSNIIVNATEEVAGTIGAGAGGGFTASDGTQVGFNTDL